MPKGKGYSGSGKKGKLIPPGGAEKVTAKQKGKISGSLSLRGVAKTRGQIKGVWH